MSSELLMVIYWDQYRDGGGSVEREGVVEMVGDLTKVWHAF